MIAPNSIHIWEQHAGQPPRIHASTDSIGAIPGIVRAWLKQFNGGPVTSLQSSDDILVSLVTCTPCGTSARPIATLWVEYPDEIMRGALPGWLDARWRAGGGGASLDTRDGTRRRVSR